MEDEENVAGEKVKNRTLPEVLKAYQYKKGQSGNPSGRPKGISIKEYLKVKFASMTDEEKEDYLNGMDKKDLIEFGEGKAKQDTGIELNVSGPISIKLDE